MSVFSDFQRMWLMRFPDNSLSNEWEQDVKTSLHRHKQKIIDLSKELEQEMLYVDYLERLLADVEKFRNNGGDPTALFSTNCSVTTKTINNENDKNDDIGNENATPLEGSGTNNDGTSNKNDYDNDLNRDAEVSLN